MGMQKDGGLVSRAIREALGTLVSPEVAAQIVERALATASLSAIPEAGSAVADWIRGSLQREIEAKLGADAAELVAAQLAPMVAHAAQSRAEPKVAPAERGAKPGRPGFPSEKPTGVIPAQANAKVRREELASTARMKLTAEQMKLLQLHREEAGYTTRPQPEDKPSQPVVDGLPRVLAASAEPRAVQALARYLAGSAAVVPIADLVGLLDALDEPNLTKPIVLIDCQRPSVHASSVAAIGEDMPSGTAIVLWGASEAVWRELERNRSTSCRWVRCSHEATTDDVASLCAALIG